MALTLTIAGVNFLPQQIKDSSTITEQIQNKGNTCRMTVIQKSGQTAPSVGSEIIFKDDTRYLFGGFVTQVTPTETGVGQLIEYAIEATDYTYLLVNKQAQDTFENKTLYFIASSLINSVDIGYGLSVSGITNPGPNVPTVAFNHIPLRQCFEILSKLTGYIWYIGYDKVVYFVDPATAAAAPEIITDTNKNHMTLAISYDISQVRNDVIVLGGSEESSDYTQEIQGDGISREWVLPYSIWTMKDIKIDGVSKTFGIDKTEPDGTNVFMYDASRGSMRLTASTATPTTSNVIFVRYTYPVDVITEQINLASINALKAVEGGDGVHSYTITDPSIISSSQAIQRALKELDLYANPVISGEFTTRTGILAGGSIFKAGQVLTVNSPVYGINTNTNYIIQKVATTMQSNNSQIEYTYKVTFGGRLFGIVDFLLALGSNAGALPADGQVRKIHATAEALTVGSTASQTKYSANSRWAPTAGQKGVWNLSQWN
jgi:hypothetical protein